jgi:TatD family-associated radical SAM protein
LTCHFVSFLELCVHSIVGTVMISIPKFSRIGVAYTLNRALYLSLTNENICTSLVTSRGPAFSMPASSGFALLEDGYEPSSDDIFNVVDSVYETLDIGSMGEDDKGICFTGFGDPLLRIDTLCESVQKIKQSRHGIPVSLTTSGLFDTELVARLNESGVRQITVNLNAADPKTYTDLMMPSNGKGFGDVCSFVIACAENGMDVTCAAVEHPSLNIKDVRSLALSLGALEFKPRPFFP